MNQTGPERMECMEVWGGNQAVEKSFETPGLKIWVYSRPHGQAVGGGDVYYLSSCASGRITRMLLADVAGHGNKVSRIAVGLRDLMRRNVNYIKQTRFVRVMNQQFSEFRQDDGFATVLVATFFAPTRKFAYCLAGHPTPFVFRQAALEWTELKNEATALIVTDTPLGVFDEADYSQRDLRLEAGDMVLCFSDAVTESRDAEGRQLGQTGVLRLLRQLKLGSADDIIPALVERITSLADGNLQGDDATLLLCQATGSAPSLKNNLFAPFRLLGPVADRTKLEFGS
jgi:serine phosphatase RsbU (regulator of sigma subunit)